jgi:hypothetical protein
MRIRFDRSFLFWSLFLLLMIAAPISNVSAAPCPNPGEQPALATDAAVQNGQITVGTCYNPANAVGIGQSAEQAKQYINSLPKQPLSNCAPPNEQNIEKLNNSFAVCAATFFKAYTAQYGSGSLTITSAYRDAASGANACAGGVNGSNHTKGLAIDVHPTGASSGNPSDKPKYQAMWKFASDHPEYGVCFPFQDHPFSGYPYGDWPHMILGGIPGSEGTKCAAQGVTKPCSGAPPLNIVTPPASTGAPLDQTLRNLLGQNQAMNTSACITSLGNPPTVAQPGTVLQSQCLTNANGQQLSPPPPPPPQQPQQPAAATPAATPATAATSPTSTTAPPPIGTVNTTPYPAGTCNPQFYCANSNYYYRASTCVDQVYQSCPSGCAASGTTCALSSATSPAQSPLSDLLSTSSTAGLDLSSLGSGQDLSALDAINAYANGSAETNTPTDVGTATPITLNPDTQNLIGQIQGSPSYSQGGLQIMMPPPQAPLAQQTFTSSDLGNGSVSPPQSTFTAQLLGSIEQVLISVSNYLKPFGGTVPPQTYGE